jgi:hypothetical protein
MKYCVIFILLLISTRSFTQVPDEPANPFKNEKPVSKEPEPKSQTNYQKEVYGSDGTYKKISDGRIILQGHHINRVFHGEFIQDSLPYIITKTYNHGNLVGYQTGKIAHDSRPPNYQEHWKKGPYFAGVQKTGIFTINKSDRIYYRLEDFTLLQEDTLFFSPNKNIEIHRISTIKRDDQLIGTPCRFIYRIYATKKADYSVKDIESALKTKTYPFRDFQTYSFIPEGEVIQYNSLGVRVTANYPDYRLTYYSNGSVQDSICRLPNPYEKYRFDSEKHLVFKMQIEPIPAIEKSRTSYTYFKEKKPFYTISFLKSIPKQLTSPYYISLLRDKPEQISSSNDSIQQVIKNGTFEDYYGTRYITQADGKIDTSFSKEMYPFRYHTKLKNGNYYFLSSYLSLVVNVLTITDSTIEGYTFNPADNKGKIWNQFTAHQILQKDNQYHYFEQYHAYRNSGKLVVQNGELYASDWIDREIKQLHINWKDGETFTVGDASTEALKYQYDLDNLAADFQKDTLFSFTTELLSEDQYKKAMSSKKISTMSQSDFDLLIRDLKIIREQEEKALSRLISNEVKNVFISSKKLCQLVYHMGYNPYFSEDEVSQLMNGLKINPEEQAPLKKLMFVPYR